MFLIKFVFLGKVLEVKEEQVHVHYWKGTWNKEWTPHIVITKPLKKREPWTQWLPKSCIILSGFLLIDKRLTKTNRRYLKQKYKELKEKTTIK